MVTGGRGSLLILIQQSSEMSSEMMFTLSFLVLIQLSVFFRSSDPTACLQALLHIFADPLKFCRYLYVHFGTADVRCTLASSI